MPKALGDNPMTLEQLREYRRQYSKRMRDAIRYGTIEDGGEIYKPKVLRSWPSNINYGDSVYA